MDDDVNVTQWKHMRAQRSKWRTSVIRTVLILPRPNTPASECDSITPFTCSPPPSLQPPRIYILQSTCRVFRASYRHLLTICSNWANSVFLPAISVLQISHYTICNKRLEIGWTCFVMIRKFDKDWKCWRTDLIEEIHVVQEIVDT